MCPWQLRRISPLLNSEALWAVTAVEFTEAVHGYTRRARHELEEARPQLVVERVDHLEAMTSTG